MASPEPSGTEEPPPGTPPSLCWNAYASGPCLLIVRFGPWSQLSIQRKRLISFLHVNHDRIVEYLSSYTCRGQYALSISISSTRDWRAFFPFTL